MDIREHREAGREQARNREAEDWRTDPRGRGRQPEGRDRLLEAWRIHLKRRTRTFTPWLVVPFKTLNPTITGQTPDLGARPVTGEAFWASPYIAVESPLGLGPTAVAGEPNFVHARVFNLGKATSRPTQVDFAWADPSLGLGPGTFHPIGTEWVEVRHGQSVDVRCGTAWVPTIVNGGHECLMVNTSNPFIAVGTGPLPGPFDPITHPFAPWLDRHVGQRNITVVALAASQVMPFLLTVSNLLPFAARTQVVATAATFDLRAALPDGMAGMDLLTALASAARAPGAFQSDEVRWAREAQPRVEGELGEVVGKLDVGALRRGAAAVVDHGPGEAKPGGALVAEATLEAGEQRALKVAITAPGAGKTRVAVVNLEQRWEGVTLGGYTILATVGTG